MNAFEISLVWCALQVTFVLLVTILLYAAVRKWGQAARATSLGAGLALTLLLSFLVFSPWPNWWQHRGENAEPPHEVTVDDARDDHVAASANVVESPELNLTAPETELESPMAAFVTTFVDSLGNPAKPSEVAVGNDVSWLAIIGYVFLVGLAMGAIRLVVGCWELLKLHRRGQSIDDRELLALVARLRNELGCRREVELRESAEITPAATFGWRRPVILLSPDWRTWTADEQQAVLAHEIAHVCRGDFLTGLWAQLGTLLHFYHPLVRWLTAQLRLEQELAADALAASVSGGSQKYLRVLAEIALREPSRRTSWPVRPFLPTRHTFLRRIEMLRDSKTIEQPIRWGLRAGLLLLVTCVGIAAAGIRNPQADSPEATANVADNANAPRDAKTAKDTADDLAYVPANSFGMVSLEVADVLKNPEMKKLRDVLSKGDELKRQFGISLNDIDRVDAIVVDDSTARLSGERPRPVSLTIVRSKGRNDVAAIKKLLRLKSEGMRSGTEVFSKTNSSRLHVAFPEAHVVLFGETVAVIEQALKAGKPGASKAHWSEAWRATRGKQFRLVADSRRVRELLKTTPSTAKMSIFAPLWNEAETVTLTIDMGKRIDLVGRFVSGSKDDAEKVQQTLQALLTLGKNFVSGLDRDKSVLGNPQELAMLKQALQLARSVMESGKIERKKQVVTFQAGLDSDPIPAIVAALLPAMMKAREAARRSQSRNNMKQLGLAMHNYYDTFKRFPPAVVIGPDGKTPHSWRVALLPFLDQKKLYDEYRMNEPWDSDHNKTLLARIPATFRDPTEPNDSTNSSYFALTGNGAAFSKKEGALFRDFTDGTSNSLLFVEAKRNIPWTKPQDIPFDPKKKLPKFGGHYDDIFLALLADGSVRVIAENINVDTLKALITIGGQEPIPKF